MEDRVLEGYGACGCVARSAGIRDRGSERQRLLGHGAADINNGLDAASGTADPGLFTVSRRSDDRGLFRAPTLRNIAATSPYMHDGRFATLDDVIDHYARGGRPGRNRSHLVTGFAITVEEKCDLIAFLESLTDEGFLRDPGLSNPWPRDNRP